MAHEARLNFTTGEGERESTALKVANEGTTAIYFNWKKVFKPNHFDIKREKIQRFYFNAQNGKYVFFISSFLEEFFGTVT